MERTVFVYLNDGVGNIECVGLVKVKDDCHFIDVRNELIADGIIEEDFIFLSERDIALTQRQEEKFKVCGEEVTIQVASTRKRQRTEVGVIRSIVNSDLGDEFREGKRLKIDKGNNANKDIDVVTVVDVESLPNDMVEQPTVNARMQSKTASKADIYKWQKRFRKLVDTMKARGRHDRFELMSRDVKGRAEFALWCIECDQCYGKGGNDMMLNFQRSHCTSKTHRQNYEDNLRRLKSEVCIEDSNVAEMKDIRSLVEECLKVEVAKFEEESGVRFKLYDPSVGGYSKQEDICIICLICERILHLFPRTGNLSQHLKDHVLSNRHVHAAMDAERKKEKANEEFVKGKGASIGHSKRSSGLGPSQGSLLSFFSNAASNEGTSSSKISNIVSPAILCWGFWQKQYKYGKKIKNISQFLNDRREGNEWYCEPHITYDVVVNGKKFEIRGTFRHKRCKWINSNGVGPFMDLQCSLCASIPRQKDFYMRVHRQREGKVERGSRTTKMHITINNLNSMEVRNMAKSSLLEIRHLQKQVFFLKRKATSLSVKVRSLRESLVESMNRKDVSRFCQDIVEAHRTGKFNGRPALWDFLRDIAQNITRPGHKRRYTKSTKSLFETVKIWGGRRMHNFLSLNFAGPSVATTMRSTRDNFFYRVGIREDTFKHLAATYTKYMQDLGMVMGGVPVIVAEDETVVKQAVRWIPRDDCLIGFCGKKEEHKCDSSFVVIVGSNEDGYMNIVQSFSENVIAHYARVLIVNPLHRRLPKLVLAIILTCNRFNRFEVRRQWHVVHGFWNVYLKNVVGPLIGHSSDGDARRRACMVEDYTCMKLEEDRYHVPWVGWPLSAMKLADNNIYGLHDQDFIHNGKKLINPLDNGSKRLYLGDQLVTLNDVWHVFNLCPGKHGLQVGDVERKDRQNWRAAQRIASRKVQACLNQLRHGVAGPPIRTLGTETYLSIVALYIDIFLSPTMDLHDRIKAAATVSFFFRLWRLWILKHDRHVLSKNFISQQTFMDIQISCHYVVLLIRLFRDDFSNLEVPLDCTGSDVCENFFSKVGGMVRNERSYDGADLLESASALNHVAKFQAFSELLFPSTHEKQENVWKVLEKRVGDDGEDISCNLSDYTMIETDEKIITALKCGLITAQEYCLRVGIKPLDSKNDKWFDKPWDHEDYFHDKYYDDYMKDLKSSHVVDDEPDIIEDEREPVVGEDYDEYATSTSELRHVFDEMLDEMDLEGKCKIDRYVIVEGKQICKSTIVSHLNGSPWLSKDRLTRVKNIVYTYPERNISTQTLLGIGSDCAIYFEEESTEQTETIIRSTLRKSACKKLQKVWYLGRVLSMRKKVGNAWRETREPIDLANRPSFAVEVNLAYYRSHSCRDAKDQCYTYNLADNSAIGLESIISLACLTYDSKMDRYRLHEHDKRQFDKFLHSEVTGDKGKQKMS